MKKIQKLKTQMALAVFLFFIILLSGIFVFFPFFKNIALALSNNYNKTLPASLNVSEWNDLDLDFVAKSGGADAVMTGILNMNNNRITQVLTPTAESDAATKQYVDDTLALVGGSAAGSVFTNWGNATCPPNTTTLYSGVAFSGFWTSYGGGSNPVCINQASQAGGPANASYADQMYPLVTGLSAELPTAGSGDALSTIIGQRIVQCAVCYRSSGTCYTSYGSFECNNSFTQYYTGYLLGSESSLTYSTSTSNNPTHRACVNRSFDGTISPSPANSVGSKWIGSRIENNFGTGYATSAFIRCAQCCN